MMCMHVTTCVINGIAFLLFILWPAGSSGQKPLALVQYIFSKEEHEIPIKKYGKSKEEKPYLRTFPSTVNKLMTYCEENKPKSAVHLTADASGGLCKAEGSGSLPCKKQTSGILLSESAEGLSNQVSC